MNFSVRLFFFMLMSVLVPSASTAQQPAASAQQPAASPPVVATNAPNNYILGPGDQISIYVADLSEEFADRTFRLDMNGEVSLPLMGRIHAAGVTAEVLEGTIRGYLTKVVKDPQVIVTIVEFGSQPVSVLGAVNTAGIVQLRGRKNLFDVLSLAGGLRSDAGSSLKITRDIRQGPINLPGASPDPTGRYNVASVLTKDILHATDPAANIPILPGDTVSVPIGEVIYVVGSVTKPGAFPLGENQTVSTFQAISLAGGLGKAAATTKAKILRTVPGSAVRSEIPIDIKKLMAGKVADQSLRPNDILFVPGSGAKAAGYRTVDALVSAGVFAGSRATF
jgi:polysaccharide export outer membrane protein